MAAWTYSDWVTYADGSSKLTRLRLHVQEVSDRLSGVASYATEGLQVSKADLTSYLERLEVKLAGLEAIHGGDRSAFTRARATQ